LLSQVRVSAALGLNLVNLFLIFGIVLLTTQYMQLVLGLSPLEAGLWSLPDGLGFVLGSLLTAPLFRLMRPSHLLSLGLTLGAAGLYTMAQVGGPTSLYVLVVGITAFSMGLAPCAAVIADLVVSASPTERAGATSALNETSSEFGGAVGIALLGSLATFLYRSGLSRTLPAGTDDTARTLALRGIATALEVAGRSGSLGISLRLAAQSAYVQAMQTSLVCTSAIAIVAAGAALIIFKRH
jgi:DHA2 family multidrug resistance protein-like MFS transporter